jgi:D-tyrosyl-tRNA(Tyr) deacylase
LDETINAVGLYLRVVVQRVSEANVRVNQKIEGKIGTGLVLLVCFEKKDEEEVIEKAFQKILKLRCFEDPKTGKMNKGILEVDKGSILAISQFTLSWRGEKGNRPGFDKSMGHRKAEDFFEKFCFKFQGHVPLEKGVFGEFMDVSIQNHGPVTFCLDF